MDGRYNRTRALFLEIQHLADHAQLSLQIPDEKAARADMKQITERLHQLPNTFPTPATVTKNGATQHLLQTHTPQPLVPPSSQSA